MIMGDPDKHGTESGKCAETLGMAHPYPVILQVFISLAG
jgi:hypothetical protein